MFLRTLSLLLALALCGLAAAQDATLTLRDGSRVRGRITGETPESVVLATPYGTLTIPPSEILNRENVAATAVIEERWIIDTPDGTARLRRTVRIPEAATDSFAVPLEGTIVSVTSGEKALEGWQQTAVGSVTLLTIPLGAELKAGDELVVEARVANPLGPCHGAEPGDLCFRRVYTAETAGIIRVEWQLPEDWSLASDGEVTSVGAGLYRLERPVRRQEQLEISATIRRAEQ